MQIHLEEDIQSIIPFSLFLSALIIDNEAVKFAQLRLVTRFISMWRVKDGNEEFSKIFDVRISNIFVYLYRRAGMLWKRKIFEFWNFCHLFFYSAWKKSRNFEYTWTEVEFREGREK